MSRVGRQDSECTYCRHRAVQCDEVERPQNQVVLDAFVHLPVRLIEAIHVDESGIDDGRAAGQRVQRRGEVWTLVSGLRSSPDAPPPAITLILLH
jgi:hypothetical protein